ncbi:protein Flattop homolog isoform X2 [Convolutriloba macropyga]|uniref:protein Flattop homolog isoform X2 n=1 Tax=Convolutriloba macropyga TaxID=536237 RepID=UPI003F51C3A6
MAQHFSANQYEEPFKPVRLGNWEVPLLHKEFPDSREGFTQIVANDRGHLLDGVPKSAKSPWGEFVGTWDMPRKFVGNITTYMGRTEEAADEIKASIGKPLNKSFNKSMPDVPELPRETPHDTCIPSDA